MLQCGLVRSKTPFAMSSSPYGLNTASTRRRPANTRDCLPMARPGKNLFGSILCSKKHGAGDGNRTHATSLEGWGSTTELHPHLSLCHLSDPRLALAEQAQMGRVGFEPTKA